LTRAVNDDVLMGWEYGAVEGYGSVGGCVWVTERRKKGGLVVSRWREERRKNIEERYDSGCWPEQREAVRERDKRYGVTAVV
ncbi:hypothetical protein HAX54_038743, partial [Datura stramonium]|nr:hypothetical protein [Datura stramonium]